MSAEKFWVNFQDDTTAGGGLMSNASEPYLIKLVRDGVAS